MEQTLTQDTIVALATPHGAGAIAVIRVSGPQAVDIVTQCWKGIDLYSAKSHTVHLGYITAADSAPIDEVLLTIMRAPHTFTGEDIIEISCHGSLWLQRAILHRIMECEARAAEPGEFTRRAFLNGRIDLTKAEAIADLIATSSQAAQRIAMRQMKGTLANALEELREQILHLASLLELELDFSEEDVEFASRNEIRRLLLTVKNRLGNISATFSRGAAIKEGIPVAIVGATNAGKSSLLNLLLGDNKAIVSDIPGTTRDAIEDTIEIGDYLFRLTDTAGLRPTTDAIEKIGIDRAHDIATRASIILHIIDATTLPSTHSTDTAGLSTGQAMESIATNATILPQLPETLIKKLSPETRIITVLNKTDLKNIIINDSDRNIIKISAKTGAGIDRLKSALTTIIDNPTTISNHPEVSTESIPADQIIPASDYPSSASIPAETTPIIITNARHAQALSQALDDAEQALQALDADLTPDLITQHLRQLIHHLSQITGAITTPEILQSIFSHFCIGK